MFKKVDYEPHGYPHAWDADTGAIVRATPNGSEQ